QTRDLPPPSFRFAVTHDTLGLGYILPTTRADLGLSPFRNVRRKAHIRNTSYSKLVSFTAACTLLYSKYCFSLRKYRSSLKAAY
ncbi:MAG: hypothetical protein IJN46_03775, partial [Lachnospiraceae bacterium]|nr:hypothetical protein [Lachnospiraceae bacterium]